MTKVTTEHHLPSREGSGHLTRVWINIYKCAVLHACGKALYLSLSFKQLQNLQQKRIYVRYGMGRKGKHGHSHN